MTTPNRATMPAARKLLSAIAASALIGATAVGISMAAGNASADPCLGVWSIGVGGLTLTGPGITGQDSAYLDVNQRVGYNSIDLNAGVAELNRLVTLHRSECPADHITVLGHSGGAAVAHIWVSRTQSYPNLNVVLLADPKRVGAPGGPGFMAVPPMSWLPAPYSGVDANFGSIPVLEVCNSDDRICDDNAGWTGYLTGVHTDYDYVAGDYSTTASGTVYH